MASPANVPIALVALLVAHDVVGSMNLNRRRANYFTPQPSRDGGGKAMLTHDARAPASFPKRGVRLMERAEFGRNRQTLYLAVV